jgi:predicted transglutaminase-like cysteine proteinase
MLLPGWQRHMPIYRVGTIESVDYSADTATVCLDPAFSSQQYLSAVDGFDDEGCSAANPVESQIADFCSRNPGHPLCTNTEAGEPINLSEAQLAQLQLVNQQVNQEFGRAQDPSGYKLGDSWDVLSGGDKGDCEDFALTKMQRLVDTYGWNPRDLKVVTAYVPHIGEYHAMLGIRTTNRGLVLLDINNDAVLQNSKTPYRLHRIALTKEEWTAIARRIEGAAVEYMTCNALAFVSGDRVVVEFPSQNYTAPKVVGFEEEPRACEFELYNFYHMPKGGITRWHSWSLDLLTRVTTNTTDTDIEFRYGVASFRLGNGIFLCGGIKPRTGYSDVIKEVLKFSPMSKSYSTRTDMPNPGRKDAAGFAVLGKGVVIGGAYFYDLDNINPYSDVDAYDDTTEAWTSKTDCPVARMGHRGFELNNKTHVLCGSEGMFKESGAYYEKIGGGHRSYDLSGDFWETKESISENRAYHQSCALGGYGLTFGGRIEGLSSPNTKNNHKYDPALDSWEQIATREIGTGFGYRYARGAVDTAYVPHSEGSYLEYSLSGDSYVGRTIEYPSLAEFYTYITGELA